MSARVAWAAALLTTAAAAQTAGEPEFEPATVAPTREVVLPVGKVQRVPIEVAVKPGYHVQSNPAAYKNLIPITLDLAPADGVAIGKPVYPLPRRLRLRGSGDVLLVNDGTFALQVPIGVYRETSEQGVLIKGSLRYQACDDVRCLMPRTAPVALTVKAKRDASAPK